MTNESSSHKELPKSPYPFPLPPSPSPWRRALSLVAVPSIHRSNSTFGTKREKERDKKRLSIINGNSSSDENQSNNRRSEEEGYNLKPDLINSLISSKPTLSPPETVNPLPFVGIGEGVIRRKPSKSRSLSLSLPLSFSTLDSTTNGGTDVSMINHYPRSSTTTLDRQEGNEDEREGDGAGGGDGISIDTSRSIRSGSEFHTAQDGDSPKDSLRSESASGSRSNSDSGSDSTISRKKSPNQQKLDGRDESEIGIAIKQDIQERYKTSNHKLSIDTLPQIPVPQNSLSSIQPSPDEERSFTSPPPIPPLPINAEPGSIEIIPISIPISKEPSSLDDAQSSIDSSVRQSPQTNDNKGSPTTPTHTNPQHRFPRMRGPSTAPLLPLPPSPPPPARSPSKPFPFLPFPYLPRSPPVVFPSSIHAPSPTDYIPRSEYTPTNSSAQHSAVVLPGDPSVYPPVPIPGPTRESSLPSLGIPTMPVSPPPESLRDQCSPPFPPVMPPLSPPVSMRNQYSPPFIPPVMPPLSPIPPAESPSIPFVPDPNSPGHFPPYPLPASPLLMVRPPLDIPHIVWLPFPPNSGIPPPPIPRFSQGRPLYPIHPPSSATVNHHLSTGSDGTLPERDVQIDSASSQDNRQPTANTHHVDRPPVSHLGEIERELYELSFPTPSENQLFFERIPSTSNHNEGRPRRFSEGASYRKYEGERRGSRIPKFNWKRKFRFSNSTGNGTGDRTTRRPEPSRTHLSTLAIHGSNPTTATSTSTSVTTSPSVGEEGDELNVIWDEVHNDLQGDLVLAQGERRWRVSVNRFKNDSGLIYHLSLPPTKGKLITITIPPLPLSSQNTNSSCPSFDPISLFLTTLLTHDESFVHKLILPTQIESFLILSEYFISPHISRKIIRHLQTHGTNFGWELFIISSKFDIVELAKIALKNMDNSAWCPLRYLEGMNGDDVREIRSDWVLELFKRRFKRLSGDEGKYEEVGWKKVAEEFDP